MRLRFAERAAQAGGRKFVSRVRLLVSSLPIEFLIVGNLSPTKYRKWGFGPNLGPIASWLLQRIIPQIMTHSAKS